MSESKRNDKPRQLWKEWVKSNLYIKKYDSAIVGGRLHQEYLIEMGFPKEKIFYGYDAVDNDYFKYRAIEVRSNQDKVRQQFPRIPTKPYFITVSRFTPRKNIPHLVKAFSAYHHHDRGNAWDLVICGSGREEELIRHFISINHLENHIHLPGFLSYQEIPNWFGLAGAFIHPALSEQWGLVVNEAMASGLPVLVSERCGCFPELISEGNNGFGFDPENLDQLTSLMLRISSGQLDLQAMGQVSLRQIEKFSPEAFAEGLKQAIQHAINHC